MPDQLKRPSAPDRISDLPFHEPMRMTWKDEPIVGMLVGTEGFPTLLVVGKDGAITSIRNPTNGGTIAFVDYLLENEFVTIFGSALERNDETDLGPEPNIAFDGRPSLRIGCPRCEVPNFIPYKMNTSYGLAYYSVNVPKDNGDRAAISFTCQRDFSECRYADQKWGIVSPTDGGTFHGYLDPSVIHHWGRNKLITEQGCVPFSEWPKPS